MKKLDIQNELQDIGQMLVPANMMECVRREVHVITKQRKAKILDGSYAESYGRNERYDVVVTNIDGSHTPLLARRIREQMPSVEVDELVKGVLGIRTARRVRKKTL